ncbi:histidine kinase [Pseudodesulfovibrio nedwellii]|uniref:histidine kinase n=1 Tax=Pseudodesulfovibrio nedwellii TaxID=2973072 RepID=A0ABM8B0W2_9BACT|nr:MULTISPECIES: ATP-binding protein [Pseudodesulfovibrio]BDQ37203.1 histidine kinase [Pseudodesulfovibrio nedwellii]
MNTSRQQRTYNLLVTNTAIEDFSLRRVSKAFRRWPEWQIASTALGGISFLALEAIGALLIINYGFANSLWAILSLGVVIFLTGIPIAYHASKENIDIDLLTRGAGFGYIGSTITSLIYAFFTIIFFAIETTIMAQAVFLCFGIPLPIGYLLCSLVIIPFSFYGITVINKLHNYTQFLWLFLWIVPIAIIIFKDPESVTRWISYENHVGTGSFDPFLFGSALSVLFSLIPQIGEQVDYLRFLPDKTDENKFKWWLAVLTAGPGWIIIGALKILCGAFLVVLFIEAGNVVSSESIDTVQLYLNVYDTVIDNPQYALLLVTLYIVICQVKINATNAYAGSLAWSNFFSRITGSHPGRAVWLLFNILMSILFAQLGVFKTMHSMLFIYAIFALSWIGTIVADLTVIKPLKIAPRTIEYKRAYLYNINPVGIISLLVSLATAIPAYFGLFGIYGKSFSTLIAFSVAFTVAPLVAILTKGKYYIRRENTILQSDTLMTCPICEKQYGQSEMVYCPMRGNHICSLCCVLDSICGGKCEDIDLKKQRKHVASPKEAFMKKTKRFLQHYLIISVVLGVVFSSSVFLSEHTNYQIWHNFKWYVITIYIFTLLIIAVWVWWFTLIQERRIEVEEELAIQIDELEQEVHARKRISEKLNKTSKQQKMILENATIGIAFIVNSKLKWCNNRFLDICFVPRGTKRPIATKDLFLDKTLYSRIERDSENFLRQGRHFNCEIPLKMNQTESEWRKLSISAIDSGNPSQGVIWLLNDINRQKKADKALKENRQRLKELNESLEGKIQKRTKELEQSYKSLHQADKMASLGILVSGMAHEINNPLNLISLNSQTMDEIWQGMMEYLRQQNEEGEEVWIGNLPLSYVQKSMPKLLLGINEGSDRVSTIVRNLKDYSRQSPVKMGGDVDINKAFRSAHMLLTNLIKNSTDNFVISINDCLPLFKGDLRRIEQVLVNLIQNSCQALKSRENSILIETYAIEEKVYFKITDQGIGISKKDLKHVRDPFYTTKREWGGTGLGLSVSAGIIKEHGGDIFIDSEEGQGTCVTLSFTGSN